MDDYDLELDARFDERQALEREVGELREALRSAAVCSVSEPDIDFVCVNLRCSRDAARRLLGYAASPTSVADCSASDLPKSDEMVVIGSPTPEAIAAIRLMCHVAGVHPDVAIKLERERNAAIKLAWELIQELIKKCGDPIHASQYDQIKELHYAWNLPKNANKP